MADYVELRAHSAFSFGDGACTPETLVETAAKYGYGALGLTDRSDLGGVIRFALACRRAGIKPVVGAELVVDGHPLALLARSAEGFRNLGALVTRSRMGDWGEWLDEKAALEAAYATSSSSSSSSSSTRGPGSRHSSDSAAGGGGRSVSDSPAPPGSGMSSSLRVDRDGRVRTRATAVTPRRKIERVPPVPRSAARPGEEQRIPADARRAGLAGNSLPPWGGRAGGGGPSGGGVGWGGLPGSGAGRGGPPRGQPALTLADLEGRTDGLHLLTGPPSGELASLIRAGRPEEALFLLSRLRELFPGRLAVEVQLHHVSGAESALAAALIELAEKQGLPWVVANDPRYVDGGSRLVHDLLTAHRADMDVDTAASWGVLHPNGEWRLKSSEEMAKLWEGREQGLEETARIADECAFDLKWVRPPLPKYPVPCGHDDDSWLRELTFRGAGKRWGQVDARQRAQLEHELGVIGRLDFAGFFLVMWDAVREARERGILCQGRGSAANSAVAFCLEITAVDPVRHGLLFERFLSEVRTDGLTEAPDIDVDFEMHRREEILDYMYTRYGRAHAAITAVTQVFHAPTAIQDCMRALGWPAETALTLSKRLHGREPSEAAEALEEGMAAEWGVDIASPKGRALLSALRVLDDVPRLRSTHPGGFVLSSQPLGEYLPIEETSMGRTILQFDKDDLDAAGVPKFDFLGLGGLTVVHKAFDAIEERTGRTLRLYDLPVDDAKTYEMIGRGETLGTFQIESRAQIQSILQTRPKRLYDIVVQVALIRPGPIQARFVRPYTRRRLGLEEVEYLDPRLEPITKRTYGIPIFQEQAMAISMALGGFSAAEADELRRAMGHAKKLPKLHAAIQRLKARMEQNGVAPETAEQITDDLYSFSNYGFPESHAWSFALIAYATAYLKAHYPAEFLMAILNAWPMGFYPPATLVHEARRNGVTVLPPCLRDGQWECTLEPLVDERRLPSAAPRGGDRRSTPPRPGGRPATPRLPSGPTPPDPTREGGSDPGGVDSPADGSDFGSAIDDPGGGRGDWEFGRAASAVARDDPGRAASPAQREEGSGEGGVPGRSQPNHPQSPPLSAEGRAVAERSATDREGSNAASPASLGGRGGEEGTPPRGGAGESVAVRIGWKHIKGLGEHARERLHRAAGSGPFTGVEDVVRRAELSRKDALHLARAGAFEAFEPGRRKAAWAALRAAGDVLPLAPARHLPFDVEEMDEEELIFLDYLATGITVAGHPMEHIRTRLDAHGVSSSADLKDVPDRSPILVSGLVVARQHPATANGTVFILLEDEHGFINIIVPPPVYAAYREVIHHAPFLLIQGRFEREDRVMNVVASRFRELKRDQAIRNRTAHGRR